MLMTIIASCLITVACNKSMVNNTNSFSNLFTDSIPIIKNSEPLLLSFNNGNSATVVNWQVTPNENYRISKVGIYATFTFNKGGVYTIQANADRSGATYIVTVSDSVFKDIDTGFAVRASKLIKVLPYEMDSFKVINPPFPNGFVWTTTGNVSYTNTSNNPAEFSFINGKTGTISVKIGNQIRSRTVWLSDSSVHDSSLDTVPFIFSDKLTITPSVTKDINGNQLLVLSAQTTYNYTSNTDIVLSQLDNINQQFTVNYGGVVMAKVPTINAKPASCISTISNIKVGKYPFVINYGNHTFIGTIELNAAGIYNFTWAKNNEVSIYPLTVQ